MSGNETPSTMRPMVQRKARRSWGRVLTIGSLAVVIASCSTAEVPTAPDAGPFLDVFASQLGVHGTATRSFTVREPGTVSVTLTSAGPPATLELGLGVGIPNSSGAGCNLTKSVVTGAASSPQLTIDADGGAYCVRVFDVGNVTENVTFSVSVLHP